MLPIKKQNKIADYKLINFIFLVTMKCCLQKKKKKKDSISLFIRYLQQ